MLNTKRLITSIAIIIICFMAFLTGYSKSANFVFADSTTDNWTQVTSNDQLVDAFRYYCKSRDLTIEGSAADAVTSFTTQTFNSICRGLGIDVTALQAHLKYETDGSNIRYLFDSTGITAYNRIFAQFLQDNELEVGDAPKNQDLYQGYLYRDNNSKSLLYIVISQTNTSNDTSNILQKGSTYILNGNNATSYIGSNITFPIKSNTSYPVGQTDVSGTTFTGRATYINGVTNILLGDQAANSQFTDTAFGEVCICLQSSNNRLWLCTYTESQHNGVWYYSFNSLAYLGEYTNGKPNYTAVNVFINTVNVINNNNYEGDTIINDDGDHQTPTPTPPDDPDPEPAPDPEDAWDIDMPDLDINWILRGKENKFPWDIPFNIMLALSILNAEPQTPEIQGTLDLKVFQWNYDLSLKQFDDIAAICRNIEFLAFLIGLMMLTKKLIWG